MKRFLLLVLITAVACTKKDLDLTGSYKMTSQRIKGGNMDTTNTNSQIKIYTGGFGFYAQFGPDSAASWGVRKLLPATGGIRESNVFGAVGSAEYPTARIYLLNIEETVNGFRQVVPDLSYRGQTLELTEEYERIDSGIPTPYDGAWELTQAFIVKGQDTTHLDITQYKFYHSGAFAFGHSVRDSLMNARSGFGYGTFDMVNDSTLTEHVEVSSYGQIVGKSFNINVKLAGDNTLLQVVDELEGAKSVESYRRLKK
jgi:hypothetical protein